MHRPWRPLLGTFVLLALAACQSQTEERRPTAEPSAGRPTAEPSAGRPTEAAAATTPTATPPDAGPETTRYSLTWTVEEYFSEHPDWADDIEGSTIVPGATFPGVALVTCEGDEPCTVELGGFELGLLGTMVWTPDHEFFEDLDRTVVREEVSDGRLIVETEESELCNTQDEIVLRRVWDITFSETRISGSTTSGPEPLTCTETYSDGGGVTSFGIRTTLTFEGTED